MTKFLITGRSGSGKSEICRELQARSLQTYDTDRVKGLVSWTNPKTGAPATPDYSQPIDPAINAWTWDAAALRRLLDTDEDIFVCGSADNQLELHHLFDKVFVLVLTPEEQRKRILKRAEHDYGKSPEMQERIINEQAKFVKAAIELGAISIDAMPSVVTVANTILEYTNEA